MTASWWQSFHDNLDALTQLSAQVQASADTALQSNYTWLVNEGTTLKNYLTTVVGQDTTAAQQGVEAVSQRVTDWLNNAYNFSVQLANKDLSGGLLTPDPAAPGAFTSWFNSFMNDPVTGLQSLAQTMNAAGDVVESVGNTANAIANLPWLWIGLGVAAIFLAPKLLEALEDDD